MCWQSSAGFCEGADMKENKAMQDIRWQQRFNNYIKAFQTLVDAVELAHTRELTGLEQQGLIQSFEFTHELAWNVLKDYLGDKGIAGLIGSKDATRAAFKNGLIEQGEDWMKMIEARNQTTHSYSPEIAQAVADDILRRFYPAFERMAKKFSALIDRKDAYE
jgi:nucleotidyltransferase substrate binding protein (TIGR01987 family)